MSRLGIACHIQYNVECLFVLMSLCHVSTVVFTSPCNLYDGCIKCCVQWLEKLMFCGDLIVAYNG